MLMEMQHAHSCAMGTKSKTLLQCTQSVQKNNNKWNVFLTSFFTHCWRNWDYKTVYMYTPKWRSTFMLTIFEKK